MVMLRLFAICCLLGSCAAMPDRIYPFGESASSGDGKSVIPFTTSTAAAGGLALGWDF